jgi:hypothetical protein
VYERSSDRGQDQARHLLHELANDLAAIQMRADILLAAAAMTEAASASLVQADLTVLRALAVHATATAEQFALVIVKAEYPAIDSWDV